MSLLNEKLSYKEQFVREMIAYEKTGLDGFTEWLITSNLKLIMYIKNEQFDKATSLNKKIKNYIRFESKLLDIHNPTWSYKNIRELFIRENSHIYNQLLDNIDYIDIPELLEEDYK
jgi:hypothetical protein